MINYNKNKLINECLTQYYETFAHTLDTADYVPKEFNEKILLYIFKNMKRQFKKIDREDRQYQKKIAARQKAAETGEADEKAESNANPSKELQAVNSDSLLNVSESVATTQEDPPK